VISSPSANKFNPSFDEPEKYDIEIIKPSTRDDWISGIRHAVDAAPAGSDSEEEMVGICKISLVVITALICV